MGKVERRVALVSLLLLLLPLASAYDITKIWADWEGNEVKTIAPGTPLPNTRIAVRLSPDVTSCHAGVSCSVSVNASSLSLDPATKNALKALSIKVDRNCKNITGSWVCYSAPFTLTTKTVANTIRYYSIEGSRIGERQTSTITLTLDSTRPKATGLRTGFCEDGVCYASTGGETPFTVTFEDTVTSFDYRFVFVGGRAGENIGARVASCSGRTCSGTITLSCRDGEQRQIQLVDISREDAQNQPVALPPVDVVCTSQSPQIVEWQPPKSDGPLPVPFSTGAITAKAKVRVFKGQPNATVDTTRINGIPMTQARCVEGDGDLWECSWQIQNLNPGKFELEFRVSDAVGNYYLAPAGHAVVVEVLNKTVSQGTRIDYFDAAVPQGGVQPEALNRMVIDLARANYMPYPLYVTYGITRKKAEARIVHQELKGCWYKLPAETNYSTKLALFSVGGARSESRVFMPGQAWDKQNRLDLQSRATRDVLKLADEFDVKCQIDFTVAEGDRIYTVPDSNNITFTVKLRESPLGQPGQDFVRKIERETNKLTTGKAKTVTQLEEYRQKMDKVCGGFEQVAQVEQIAGSLKVVAGGLCTATMTYPAGVSVQKGADGIIGSIHPIMQPLWGGNNPQGGTPGRISKAAQWTAATAKSTNIIASNNAFSDSILGNGGFVKKICRQVNCRVTADTGSISPQALDSMNLGEYMMSSSLGTDASDGISFSEIISANNIADPEASLTGALSTMCIGGVIYNLQKDVAIDCQYLACLKEQSLTGSSIAVCTRAQSYNKCMQVYGEIGELPYARVFKNILDNINHAMTNLPYIITEWQFYNTCADSMGTTGVAKCSAACPDWKCIGCQFGNALLQVVDAQRQSEAAQMGIRNIDAAEASVKVCKDAAGTPKTNKVADRGFQELVNYVAREGGRQEDLRYRAESDPTTKGLTMSGGVAISEFPAVTGAAGRYDHYYLPPSYGSQDTDLYGASLTDGGRTPYGEPVGYTVRRDESNNIVSIAAVIPSSSGEPSFYDAVTFSKPLTEQEYEGLRLALGDRDTVMYLHQNQQELAALMRENSNAFAAGGPEFYRAMLDYTDKEARDAYIRRVEASIVAHKAMEKKFTNSRDSSRMAAQTVQYISAYYNTGCAEKPEQEACKRLKAGLENGGVGIQSCKDKTCTVRICSGPRTGDCPVVTIENADKVAEFALIERNNQLAGLAGQIGSYAAKWLMDQGMYDKLRLDLAFTKKLSYKELSKSICEGTHDISDNEDGAIYSLFGNAKPVGFFGTERRLIENSTGKAYNYVTLMYLTNPQRGPKPQERYNYTIDIVLTDLKSCLGPSCPEHLSLLKADAPLPEGESIARGNGPRTHIIYLPGEYGRICIRFNKPFPEDGARSTYCRTISEQVFETGTSVPPATGTAAQSTRRAPSGPGSSGQSGQAGEPPVDPWGGWS